MAIIPRDGLRERFDTVLPDPQMPWAAVRRFKLELDRDGFAAGQPITADKPREISSSWSWTKGC